MRPCSATIAILAGLQTDVDLPTEIFRVSEGVPYTLRVLVEALRDDSLSPACLTRQAPGLEAHIRNELRELSGHARSKEIRALLGLCAAAHGPLTNEDIQALDGQIFSRRQDVEEAAQPLARFLLRDGGMGSGYVFHHPMSRELFLENILSEKECYHYRSRFVAYGERWFQNRHPSLPNYILLFLIHHILETGDFVCAAAIATAIEEKDGRFRQPWAEARFQAEGSYSGYFGNVDAVWRVAEKNQDLGLALRCALVWSSLRSLN